MNWIKSVRLENFQSHLDTLIEFDQGLNVIIGQSDSGKTAIFRGIRWALFNQPRGSDFIRVGADFVRVTVEFSNDVTIIRERTASKNRYILKEQGKDDFILEGFGVHVPKEILDAHKMNPLRIERDFEINLHLAEQLDGPFLLDQSPAIRAKTIGRISGAHFLDMAIRDTAKDVQKLKQQINYTEEEKEKIIEKLAPFEFLDEAKRKLEKAKNDYERLKQAVEKRKKLLEMKAQYEQIKLEQKRWENVYHLVKEVDKWETKRLLIEKLHERVSLYNRRLQERNEIEKNITTCKVWIDKTKHSHEAEKQILLIKEQNRKVKELKLIFHEWQRLSGLKQQVDLTLVNTSFATEERMAFVKKIGQKYEQTKVLRNLKIALEQVNRQLLQIQSTISRLNQTDVAEQHVKQIENNLLFYKKLLENKQAIRELSTQLAKGYKFLEEKKLEEANLKKDYEQKLVTKGTCPTCGSDIDKEKVQSFLQ